MSGTPHAWCAVLGRLLISNEALSLLLPYHGLGREAEGACWADRHSSRQHQASRCDNSSSITRMIDAFPAVFPFARFLMFLVALAFRIGRVRCRLWGGIEGMVTPVRMLDPLPDTLGTTRHSPAGHCVSPGREGLLWQYRQMQTRSLEASSILRGS